MKPYLLPGSAAKRTLRDWLVDVAMFALAALIGLLVMIDARDRHTELLWIGELICGPIALVALGWRRSHPLAVGVIAIVLSAVSGLAAGAAVAALFNLAVRGSRRVLLWALALTALTTAIYPLVYDDGYVWNLLVGALITVVVLGWGLLVRVQRDLVRTLHERTLALEAEHRVVQEGLTNARKHAPAAAVGVTVRAGDELVVLVVSRHAASAANGTPGAGTGLVGLGERVALAGGELDHGPDERGDFVLRATLPWP
jgi:hypothetical protein